MSTMRKHLGWMAVVSLLAASAATDAAAENFRARTLRGAWGFTASGTLFTGTPSQTPAVAVGVTTFDGVSSCTSEAKLNSTGTAVSVAASSCSYTVNADGTGTQLTVFPGLGSFSTDFVIVDNAKEFRFILSDQIPPGLRTVASGVAKRQ
jgi:hypothetical protein